MGHHAGQIRFPKAEVKLSAPHPRPSIPRVRHPESSTFHEYYLFSPSRLPNHPPPRTDSRLVPQEIPQARVSPGPNASSPARQAVGRPSDHEREIPGSRPTLRAPSRVIYFCDGKAAIQQGRAGLDFLRPLPAWRDLAGAGDGFRRGESCRARVLAAPLWLPASLSTGMACRSSPHRALATAPGFRSGNEFCGRRSCRDKSID